MYRLIFDKEKVLRNICIVLVTPQVPENIGLTARILKNTSSSPLRLVNPNLAEKSFEVAKRAKDVLKKAKIYPNLREAIKDTYFVFGTTRRRREYKVIYNFRCILPQIVAMASRKKISILFGRENFGLSKDELELCHSIFYIPGSKAFPSYNLAFSAGIVCYEIFNFLQDIFTISFLDLAKEEDIQALFNFVKTKLEKRFERSVAKSMVLSLRRMFRRTHLTRKEIEILKTIFIKSS